MGEYLIQSIIECCREDVTQEHPENEEKRDQLYLLISNFYFLTSAHVLEKSARSRHSGEQPRTLQTFSSFPEDGESAESEDGVFAVPLKRCRSHIPMVHFFYGSHCPFRTPGKRS